MKARKLIQRLGEFLNADTRTQMQEIKSIRKVLKELKRKEHKLRNQIQQQSDQEELNELQLQLDVIYAQRRKGVDRVRELRRCLKDQSASKEH